MLVLGRVEDGAAAVGAAGDDDADLAGVVDESLEHERLGLERLPGRREVGGRAEHGLALAVIAEPGGLQDGGEADPDHGGFQLGQAADRGPGGGGHSGIAQERFLGDAVLADAEAPTGRGVRGGWTAADRARWR